MLIFHSHSTKLKIMNQPLLKICTRLTFFALLFGGSLFSQTSQSLPYDSNYIDKYSARHSIRIYTSQKRNHIYLFNTKWSDRITLSSVQKYSAGLGFAYKGVGIDLGIAVYRNSILPDQKTKGFNFISTLYRGRNVIDMTFQINKGFAQSGDSAGKTINITRNDISEFNFGVNYNYVFNYRKFSFKAAMSGTQIQKKSAGSPLLGVFLSNINIIADDTLISDKFSSLFNRGDIGSQINVFSMGLTGGYAYTLVLPHRFYITASLIPGIAFSIEQSRNDSLNLFNVISSVAPKLISRNAIGYSGVNFYVIGLFGIDINGTALRNKNYLFYTPEKMKLIFGYRIK